MSWVRIHDGVMTNAKVQSLSDAGFRLWVLGLCYCQTALTDGLIPKEALRQMGAKAGAIRELTTSKLPGRSPLWEADPVGFKVHDYLQWNASREEVIQSRAHDRNRAKRFRNALRTPLPTVDEQRSSLSGSGSSSSLKESEKTFLPDARSKRPIFKGQRLVVFEWQLTDCLQVLGKQADDFDLHEWFFVLDAALADTDLVLPKRDGGKWLQAELLKEVKKRHLPMAGQDEENDGERWAWSCRCGEVHEGTAGQNRRRECLKTASAH